MSPEKVSDRRLRKMSPGDVFLHIVILGRGALNVKEI
jgi:hypothetical protein